MNEVIKSILEALHGVSYRVQINEVMPFEGGHVVTYKYEYKYESQSSREWFPRVAFIRNSCVVWSNSLQG